MTDKTTLSAQIGITYGWETIGAQEPYFTLTQHTRGTYGEVMGPCSEDLLRAMGHDQLAECVRWHLTFAHSGPLHYVANAVYHLALYFGVSQWPTEDKAMHLQHFNSVVVMGAAPGDVDFAQLVAEGLDHHGLVVPCTVDQYANEIRTKGIDVTMDELKLALPWALEKRLPALMAQMKEDMAAIGLQVPAKPELDSRLKDLA